MYHAVSGSKDSVKKVDKVADKLADKNDIDSKLDNKTISEFTTSIDSASIRTKSDTIGSLTGAKGTKPV